jgi:hypothetical protein
MTTLLYFFLLVGLCKWSRSTFCACIRSSVQSASLPSSSERSPDESTAREYFRQSSQQESFYQSPLELAGEKIRNCWHLGQISLSKPSLVVDRTWARFGGSFRTGLPTRTEPTFHRTEHVRNFFRPKSYYNLTRIFAAFL